jgi:hypothetical protein
MQNMKPIYYMQTPKKMLGATLNLTFTTKAQPSEGVALEKARCTETVCAAGKKTGNTQRAKIKFLTFNLKNERHCHETRY